MKNCSIIFYIDKEKKDTVAYKVVPETTLSVNATILLWLHGNHRPPFTNFSMFEQNYCSIIENLQ